MELTFERGSFNTLNSNILIINFIVSFEYISELTVPYFPFKNIIINYFWHFFIYVFYFELKEIKYKNIIILNFS